MAGTNREPAALSRTAAERIGETVDGRYRIEEVVGIGGLGVVYRAEHTGLRRFVALKLMHDIFADHDELRSRFEREARALSALDHPNIVAITDFGTHEGSPYLAMALIEGEPLSQRLTRGPLDVDLAIEIIRQVLEALIAAHAAGIVHRDLKPGNIMLEERAGTALRVRIVDFGLAKIAEPQIEGAPDATLTKMGTVIGSPSYMAPEQTTAEPADERADLYSLGIILYEMLVGRCPFVNEDKLDTVRAHLTQEVPRPESLRPGLALTPALDALIFSALAKSRGDRFASAEAMRAAVDDLPAPAATVTESLDGPGGTQPLPTVQESQESQRPQEPQESQGVEKADKPPEADQSPRAPADAPAKPSEANHPGRRAAVAALAIAGTLGLGVTLLAVALSGDDGPDGAMQDRADAYGDDGMMNVGEEELPALDGRPHPDNPLTGELPQAILLPFGIVHGGGELNRAQQRQLQEYQNTHEDDARASLILAHDYAQKNWYRDALPRYERAYRIDEGCRGNPWMRQDLLRMVAAPTYGNRAMQLVRRIYGAEAIPFIQERLIESGDLDDRERRRLEQLLRRVE